MIDKFLSYIAHELCLSPNTVSAYRTDLLMWHDFATRGGQRPFTPEAYTVNQLRLWVAESARTVSVRTVRRRVQSLRAFYRYLMRNCGLLNNPAAELQLSRLPKSLPVYVRPAETEKMIDSLQERCDRSLNDLRDCLIVDMLYSTGMRCSELIGLTDGNVDTRRGELKVLGKRNKERIIPFGKELNTLITKYREIRGASAPGAPFFTRPDGRPLYRKMVYNVVHQAMLDEGVHAERMSPHVLRHSFATDMLNEGAGLNSVQQLLGHASLTTTQIYTHITYRELQHNYQLAHPRAQKKS